MIMPIEQRVKVYPTENIVHVEVGSVISLTSSQTIIKTYECGEIIGGNKIVYLGVDNKLYIADHRNIACLNRIVGMSKQAGEVGDLIEVVIFGEIFSNLAINPGDYYLFEEGMITNNIVNNGVVIKIGNYISYQKVFINIGEYIFRI